MYWLECCNTLSDSNTNVTYAERLAVHVGGNE